MIKEEDVIMDSSSEEEEHSEAPAVESEVKEVETPAPEAEEPAAKVEESEPEQKVPYNRFAKVNRKYRELQEEVAQLKATKAEPVVQAQQDTSGKPQMPAIDPYDSEYNAKMVEYQEKLTDWKLDQRDKQREADKQAQKAQELKENANKKFDQFYQEDQEYQRLLQEVIDNDEQVKFPAVLNEVIQYSDFGPQIDKYVLQHRDTLLHELQAMPPAMQAFKIGEIVASFGNNAAPSAPVPKTTSAPPVIETEPTGSARVQDDDAKLRERYGKSYSLT